MTSPQPGSPTRSVFLANLKENSPDPAGKGQLVTVVLSLASVEQTTAQLQALGSSRSDASKGRFEGESLVTCPTTTVVDMATWARGHAAQLDQHGLLSVLYTAMTLFGPAEARAAFESAFADGPWWCGPAAGPAGHRVCRDPGPLVGAETGSLLAGVSPAWHEAWRALGEGSAVA